jgi:hypothetical protein
VPFHFAFALGDLVERSNAARCEIVDPGARLGYGEDNSVSGLSFPAWPQADAELP